MSRLDALKHLPVLEVLAVEVALSQLPLSRYSDKLVPLSNEQAVVQSVATGAADLGVVYQSSLTSPAVRNRSTNRVVSIF